MHRAAGLKKLPRSLLGPFVPVECLGGEPVAIDRNLMTPRKHLKPGNVVAVLVRDENRIEAGRSHSDALEPLDDLPGAKPAIYQDPALARGDQRTIPTAATAEYR